jgi:hypothetical protein
VLKGSQVPSGLSEPVGDHVQGFEVVTEAEVGAGER